jgi:hypothetical protein
VTSSSLILSSDLDYYYYEYQPDTILAMSGIQDHQASFSVCDNEGCNHEHQDGRDVPIFEEEAYKVFITALEDASLQLRCGFSIFTAPIPASHPMQLLRKYTRIFESCQKWSDNLESPLRRLMSAI